MTGRSAQSEGALKEGRTPLLGTLEALRTEREAILDAVGLGALTLGPDGETVMEATSVAARLLGRSREALVGLRLSGLIHPADIPFESGSEVSLVQTLAAAESGTVGRIVCRPLELGQRRVVLVGRWGSALTQSFRSTAQGTWPQAPRSGQDEQEFPDLVGKSSAIREICRLIGKVAPTDSTVLIQGRSGTGKEVVAKTIHHHSARRKGRFVKVNCASLSESLLESELFGHVKGAFTGAIRDRKGRFSEADEGTILLDEIGSMSLTGQTCLLRVLQEREFEPVGSSVTRSFDARVIATTNIDLERAVEEGAFREDLFFRLGVVKIWIPPLRERMGDVPLLASGALRRFSRRMSRPTTGFHPEAMQALLDHDWPGNVRELENVVEHALVVEEGPEISRESLPLGSSDKAEQSPEAPHGHLGLRRQLDIIEKQIVLQALTRVHWIRKNAARDLGIDPRNLSYFLHKHDISDRDRVQAEGP